MAQFYFVTNRKSEYVLRQNVDIDWGQPLHEQFGHLTEKMVDAWDYNIIDFNLSDVTDNGIPYAWGVCRDGGIFTLIVDTTLYTAEDVIEAKNFLKRTQDVVKLYVLKLKPFKGVGVA